MSRHSNSIRRLVGAIAQSINDDNNNKSNGIASNRHRNNNRYVSERQNSEYVDYEYNGNNDVTININFPKTITIDCVVEVRRNSNNYKSDYIRRLDEEDKEYRRFQKALARAGGARI